jgi:hypothetical protein
MQLLLVIFLFSSSIKDFKENMTILLLVMFSIHRYSATFPVFKTCNNEDLQIPGLIFGDMIAYWYGA